MKTEKVKCIICGEEFERSIKKANSRGLKSGIRQHNSVTCSTKCSREYTWKSRKKEWSKK